MKCLVVSPEKTVLDVEATSIVLPLFDGECGIMPHHAPMIARLGAGELRIKGVDGTDTHYYVEGGFVEVLEDVVALLTMHAQPAAELSVEQAEQQLQAILEKSAGTSELAALKEERLAGRRARLRVAKKMADKTRP